MKKYELGVLMLNTSFHRPKGDIGNPGTYPFPVAYEVVEKATIQRVVKAGDPALIEPFIQAAKVLQRKGVKAITTSCGFLALFQKEIQRELSVPFYSSSLIQIPMVSIVTGGTVGVITARKSSLTLDHLRGVDAHNTPIIIAGMDDMPAFSAAIIEETKPLNMDAVTLEMQQVISKLTQDHPSVKAIVLECTNMPPYKNAIKEVTNLPLFDINTLTHYLLGSIERAC